MNRRPTIIDVARAAGVSKSTVARVVSGEPAPVREATRRRVLEAVEQLGYAPNAIAGSLRSDRTYMLALSIPDITNPFWPEVARGVQDAIEAEGYAVVLLNNDWNAAREHKHLQMMRRNQFDGLIINPTGTVNDDLTALHIPVVVLGSEGYPDFDTVGSDTLQAGRLALDHLLALGHRRIAFIAGPPRRPKTRTQSDNYRHILGEHGLPFDPDLLVQAEFTQEGGFGAMGRLIALPHPPTAVFAANDIIALGALRAAQQAGLRVPEQLSIIGVDDIYAAATTFPPLTTIAKPKYDIGATAARYLLERIAEQADGPARHQRLPCQLIARGSTARPPV